MRRRSARQSRAHAAHHRRHLARPQAPFPGRRRRSARRPTACARRCSTGWAARVPGARCLDLFAGSGALGLEALSRGAAHVTFVEQDAAAARELRARLLEWRRSGARGASVRTHCASLPARRRTPFDIVFLDPPFDCRICWRVRAGVLGERRLAGARGAHLCRMRRRATGLPPLPTAWTAAEGEAGRRGRVSSATRTRRIAAHHAQA